MITRILDPSEYATALKGTDLETAWVYVDAHPGAQILVGELRGQVVWCWAVVPIWHLEGAWVHPDHRRTAVAGLAWRAMARYLADLGIPRVMTAALTDDVASLIVNHLGGELLPGEHYVVPIPGA